LVPRHLRHSRLFGTIPSISHKPTVNKPLEQPGSPVLVTEEGVLVIDTRTHPRDGRDLLDRIRKVTDKPIKWVINSHFHGDHYMGNFVFKTLGATFVSHEETARIMQQVATAGHRRCPRYE